MTTKLYSREKAVAYAHQYALSRNPRYYDFSGIGGDCTSFASQVLFSGSGIMDYRNPMGWYYRNINDRAPAWSGTPFLYNYLTRQRLTPGPFAKECDILDVRPGDLVQLSFDGERFAHTPVVVAAGNIPSPDNILVAAHSYDCDNRPLSDYTYALARFLSVQGVVK